VTVLFVSIAVEQDEFIDWIDDWFRQMEQYDLSEERMKLFRKVMALMNIYVE
jgi:bifunctional pyridoxal-dependent enzyme with beta-cystathionase and maltose regulon repressor activities